MQIRLAAESHVPCFQERVGTGQSRYMIAVRLPWRLRARPSATLHEIQVRSEERTRCLSCYKMSCRTSREKLSAMHQLAGTRSYTEESFDGNFMLGWGG